MLSGKVFLITGANGGLGGACAVELARRGASVILLGRKVRQLERVYDAVLKVGPEPMLYPLDLEGAAPDDFFEMAQTLEREVGRLDGVVHLAANFEGLTPMLGTDPAKLARAVHVNFTSMSWLTQSLMPLLERTAKVNASKGQIVVAVDDPARVGGAFWGGYGIAHQARQAWISTVATELGADSNVDVVGFMPGPMRTMLRSRAYANDVDTRTRAPQDVAVKLASLLASTSSFHGRLVHADDVASTVILKGDAA